jgi:hypothetical protein
MVMGWSDHRWKTPNQCSLSFWINCPLQWHLHSGVSAFLLHHQCRWQEGDRPHFSSIRKSIDWRSPSIPSLLQHGCVPLEPCLIHSHANRGKQHHAHSCVSLVHHHPIEHKFCIVEMWPNIANHVPFFSVHVSSNESWRRATTLSAWCRSAHGP